MSHTDGAVKKSLFIQCAHTSPWQIAQQLEHVRLHHKDPSKDDYIYNVVLDEIGDERGLHINQLDTIAPYLRKTFDNVFVGSHYIRWTGAGTAYAEGMANSRHRWRNLVMQKNLWQAFVARYPSIPIHWYINHEGVLDYFDIPEVRAGYGAYLLQSVKDSHAIKPRRAVLWSPAVWSGKPLTSLEEAQIALTFRRVRYLAQHAGHHAGVNWLHLQDMMGRGRADITEQDVLQWYRELKAAYSWDSLRVNMEYFTRNEYGQLVPEDPAVIQARENWYQQHGVPLGASWELRWWYANHKDL